MVEHTKVRRVMFQLFPFSIISLWSLIVGVEKSRIRVPVGCRSESNRRRGETNSFALYIQGHVELNPVRHLLSFRKGWGRE